MDPVLRFVWSDFLRIVPWHSSPFFTTILGNYFWNFSPSIEHATARDSSFFIKFKKPIYQQHRPQRAWKCISHFRHFHRPMDPTVDGRNSPPVDRKFITLLKGCFTSQVVGRISSINSIKGKSLEFTIHLYRLIPQKWVIESPLVNLQPFCGPFLSFLRRLQRGNRGVSEPPFDCLGHRRWAQ